MILRLAAPIACGGGLAAMLFAATPDPLVEELDEVAVTATVNWPIEDYLEFPQYDSVVVSPDARYVATGWSEVSFNRRLSLYEYPSMKPFSNGALQTFFGVTDVRWLDGERLLVQPDWPLLGFRRLRNPMGTMEIRNINSERLHSLYPPRPGTLNAFARLRNVDETSHQARRGSLAHGPVRSVGARADARGKLLIQTLWTANPELRGYGVFEMDLATGKQERVAILPMRDVQVLAGPGGKVALAWGVNAADEQVVYYLPQSAREAGRDWQLVARSRSGGRGLIPVAWTGRGEEYYALEGRDSPTRAVVVWNAADGSRRLLYRHDQADMDEAWLDPQGKPWMFSGLSNFPVYWYPDPEHPLARLHRQWAQRLPSEHVEIMNASDDLSTAVMRVSSGSRPTMFLLLDVHSGQSPAGMNSYPKLRGRRLSPVEAISFRARDGLAIQGYLTTPLNEKGEKMSNLPLLVIAHHGPRDGLPDYRYLASYRYDFERQLFASRGYAVLEVNPRGSAGRGLAFEQAGDGRWGAEVQDDFADAVRWAIQDGVAAPGQVCFYGTGYGAYSAMMSAAREPDLFKCVIGVAGIYDLPGIAETMAATGWRYDSRLPVPENASAELREATRRLQMENADPRSGDDGQIAALDDVLTAFVNNPMGVPEGEDDGEDEEAEETMKVQSARFTRSVKKEKPKPIPLVLQRAFGTTTEELAARSAISHAASIKAKVLLLNQYQDTDVPVGQYNAMRRALRRAGNRAEAGTIGAESDGYMTPESRATVYKRMLGFMAEHIGQ